MPKFIVDVELDGYDTMEEMFNAITEDDIYEALENHSFTVNKIDRIENE